MNIYVRGEPNKIDKSNAWKTAIGLQDVDELKTSEYLLETAKEHIEGKITIYEADKRIRSFYEERGDRYIGSSEASIEYLYPKDNYDLVVDSSFKTSEIIAEEIFAWMNC